MKCSIAPSTPTFHAQARLGRFVDGGGRWRWTLRLFSTSSTERNLDYIPVRVARLPYTGIVHLEGHRLCMKEGLVSQRELNKGSTIVVRAGVNGGCTQGPPRWLGKRDEVSQDEASVANGARITHGLGGMVYGGSSTIKQTYGMVHPFVKGTVRVSNISWENIQQGPHNESVLAAQ